MLSPGASFAEAHNRTLELEHNTGAWCSALTFMYTHTLFFDVGAGDGNAPPSVPKAIACFKLADYLGAESLRRACVAWMREYVSNANCCSLFASGLDLGDMYLADAIVQVATERIGACVSYEARGNVFWNTAARLTASHMQCLLRSPDLKVVSESALIDAAISWCENAHEEERTPENIVLVMSLVDLQRLSPEFLACMFLSPREVLSPARELFATALARNIAKAPKRAPRARVIDGMVFARQSAPRAPFEFFVGNPEGKMYDTLDAPTFAPRCALVACDKRILAIGGDVETDGVSRAVSSVDILDLVSGVVTQGPSMRAALMCVSLVADSARVFCCGGTDADGGTVQSIDVLSHAPARWSHFATMSSRRTCCASTILRGSLYVLGGINGSTRAVLDSVEVFDLATRESRATHTRMPFKRHSHAVVSVGAHIYVLGGTDDDDEPTSTAVVYDPASRVWHELPQMSHARTNFSAAVFGDHIYVCGGTNAEHPCERLCVASRSWARIALASPPHAPLIASVVLAL